MELFGVHRGPPGEPMGPLGLLGPSKLRKSFKIQFPARIHSLYKRNPGVWGIRGVTATARIIGTSPPGFSEGLPEDCPGTPDAPRPPQDVSKTPQDAHRRTQDAPKTHSRRPQDAPRRSQDAILVAFWEATCSKVGILS